MCNVLAELDHRLQLVEKPDRFDFVEMKRRQFAKALAQEFRFILCVERTLLANLFCSVHSIEDAGHHFIDPMIEHGAADYHYADHRRQGASHLQFRMSSFGHALPKVFSVSDLKARTYASAG
jgi:hypothetical protein